MKTNEPLLADDKNSWFRFVLGGFLVWTLLLSITTLSIQHSSSPMIHWEGIPIPGHSNGRTDTPRDPVLPKPTIDDKGETKPPKHDPDPDSDSDSNPDAIGVVAGVASVVGFVMLAPAAPVALIAGVGMMMWFIVRSALSSI